MPDWHGAKVMWVDWMLDSCCDFQLWHQPWPWSWIFNVNFLNSCIREVYESIGCYTYSGTLSYVLGFTRSTFEHAVSQEWEDLEPKGCESIGCQTHILTLNFDLTHDLDLGFSRSVFEIAVSQEREGRSTWNERDMTESIGCYTYNVTLSYDLEFEGQNLKSTIIGIRGWIDMEPKRCESIGCWTQVLT